MGLHREFSWPKLWERKGHRCTGLPRTLICTVWGSSPSQLAAGQALESIYKSLWLCLRVGKCIWCTGWGWLKLPLAISAASLSQRIPEPEHSSAQGTGLLPTTPGKVGNQPGAHLSQAQKEKEVELQAGKMCDTGVSDCWVYSPTSVSLLFFLIVLVIVVKCRCYAMVGLVTLATANCSARSHL